MTDFVSNIDFAEKRVSVRTNRGHEVARKMAMLTLLEERLNPRELTTSLVTYAPEDQTERWYVFSW